MMVFGWCWWYFFSCTSVAFKNIKTRSYNIVLNSLNKIFYAVCVWNGFAILLVSICNIMVVERSEVFFFLKNIHQNVETAELNNANFLLVWHLDFLGTLKLDIFLTYFHKNCDIPIKKGDKKVHGFTHFPNIFFTKCDTFFLTIFQIFCLNRDVFVKFFDKNCDILSQMSLKKVTKRCISLPIILTFYRQNVTYYFGQFFEYVLSIVTFLSHFFTKSVTFFVKCHWKRWLKNALVYPFS
jgi:hypothetical protein